MAQKGESLRIKVSACLVSHVPCYLYRKDPGELRQRYPSPPAGRQVQCQGPPQGEHIPITSVVEPIVTGSG